jgi:ribosomal protein S18 acetylase RimI-like enzyme
MNLFLNTAVSFASVADVPVVTSLLNSAYRGESSTRGWTTEAHLIAGNVRTDESHLLQTMEQENSVVLKYCDDQSQVIGCVNLQRHGHRIYLGMLSVSPNLQGRGIGKQLLAAAEEYALANQCKAIYMTVISVRTDIVSWYERHGYRDTGERKFFEEDGLTGKHLQPLEFMTLEKILFT